MYIGAGNMISKFFFENLFDIYTGEPKNLINNMQRRFD